MADSLDTHVQATFLRQSDQFGVHSICVSSHFGDGSYIWTVPAEMLRLLPFRPRKAALAALPLITSAHSYLIQDKVHFTLDWKLQVL